jgi:hypothetical protein
MCVNTWGFKINLILIKFCVDFESIQPQVQE